MAFEVEYKSTVQGDLRRIGRKEAARIVGKLERELRSGASQGKPLHGQFQGLWRLRIGDDRVIYVRTDRGFLVLRIAHRREAYRT